MTSMDLLEAIQMSMNLLEAAFISADLLEAILNLLDQLEDMLIPCGHGGDCSNLGGRVRGCHAMTSTNLLEATMTSADVVEATLNLVDMVKVILSHTNPVSSLYGCYLGIVSLN
jgi:uncharacterized protein YjbI with pentapeptide repeats